MRNNPEVMKDIEERIRLHFGLVPEVAGEAAEEPGNAPTKRRAPPNLVSPMGVEALVARQLKTC